MFQTHRNDRFICHFVPQYNQVDDLVNVINLDKALKLYLLKQAIGTVVVSPL